MNEVIEIGNIVKTGNWGSPQRGRIYSVDGISPCIYCFQGGNLEPKILLYETHGDSDLGEDRRGEGPEEEIRR